MKTICSLFLVFFKLGLFTFGGGLAMIPLIQNEVVSKRKWISDEDMFDMIAVAESTPGVIAVNMATFIGYRMAKFWGSFFATLGVVLPSVIVISIIAYFFDDFLAIPTVSAIFSGIRVGVVVLIFNAGLRLFKKLPKTALAYILIAIGLCVSLFTSLSVFIIIVTGAALGILVQFIQAKEGTKTDGLE